MMNFDLNVMAAFGHVPKEQQGDADMYLHNIIDVVNKHNIGILTCSVTS